MLGEHEAATWCCSRFLSCFQLFEYHRTSLLSGAWVLLAGLSFAMDVRVLYLKSASPEPESKVDPISRLREGEVVVLGSGVLTLEEAAIT